MLSEPQSPLEVFLVDTVAQQNVKRLAETSGYQIEEEQTADSLRMTLTPRQPVPQPSLRPDSRKKTVLLCASDKMGDGAPELGKLLLKNFLITLLETTETPEAIYLVNSGVKLVCTGAETVEIFEKLACRGVDIASCGLCLDFYKVKEQLQIGRITNMLEITEAQLDAERIIRP
jgi:selenium metabolism protein YedF